MTSGSPWQRHDVLGRVLDILSSQRNPRDPERRDGYPFLSPYQLAILLDESHPEIRQDLGDEKRIGGTIPFNEPDSDSLAHYLSTQLSLRLSGHVHDQRINNVEKAGLSLVRSKINCSSKEGVIEVTRGPLAMFRYKPEP